MDKRETLALYAQGKDVWNAWAKKMLDERAKIETEGKWAVDGLDEADNEATSNWFRAANANFKDLVFEESVDFYQWLFPAHANFGNCIFEEQAVFNHATFSRHAGFHRAEFRGDAWFGCATFNGDAHFVGATFGQTAMFNNAAFKTGASFHYTSFERAMFQESLFSGDAIFLNSTFHAYTTFVEAKFLKGVDFAAIVANRSFTLEGAHFEEVPDFIQAHFEEAPRLDDVLIPEVCGIPHLVFPFLRGTEASGEASAKYRALKRLAIQAHDHTRELDYLASELKALRGNADKLCPCPLNLVRKDDEGKRLPMWPGGLRGTARYWVGLCYEILSNFGRSIILPLVWWGLALIGFAWLYNRVHASVAGQSADLCLSGQGEPWNAEFGLSIRKALPFAGVASANKLDQIYACLYGIHGGGPAMRELPERFTAVIPDVVDYLGILQFLLSLILIFLFSMAVRNHFRIR